MLDVEEELRCSIAFPSRPALIQKNIVSVYGSARSNILILELFTETINQLLPLSMVQSVASCLRHFPSSSLNKYHLSLTNIADYLHDIATTPIQSCLIRL